MADLAGQRVVVTRAAHQAEELARPLREINATVILLPTIAIAPPADPLPLQQAAQNVNRFDWLIFTSVNATEYFVHALVIAPREVTPKIAAIGDSTAHYARSLGFTIHLVPEISVSEGLVSALADHNLEGKAVLIPSASLTRNILPAELKRRGASVHVVEAYRNVSPSDTAERAAAIFRDPLPDWITFASPSAVNTLASLIHPHTLSRCKLASIGPITSEALRKHGFEPTVEANPHNISGLIASIQSTNQKL